MHAKDLLKVPHFEKQQSTRKQPQKVPSWWLTGPETIKYIEEADGRQKEKQKKADQVEKIKKEAVKEARKKERESKRK